MKVLLEADVQLTTRYWSASDLKEKHKVRINYFII